MTATERIDQLKKERRNELRSKALAAQAEIERQKQVQYAQVKQLLPVDEQYLMEFYQGVKCINDFRYARFCVPMHSDLLLRIGKSYSPDSTYFDGWHWDHCDGPEECDCLADALVAAEYTV